MSRRHLLILALLLGVVALVQWTLVSPPAPIRSSRLPDEAWKIQQQPEFDVKAALATLKGASLWGKLADIAPAAQQPSDPKWQFLGAITRGQERQVIVAIENQPEQRLVPGDTLPDGSQILSVENDYLCLLIDGQKRSRAIYPQGRLGGVMPAQEDAHACHEDVRPAKGKSK